MRWSYMKETIAALMQRMKAAAAAWDYEEAQRCLDMISLMRGGATAEEALEALRSGSSQAGSDGVGDKPAEDGAAARLAAIG